MKTKTLALLTAMVALSAPQAAFAFDPDKSADVMSRSRAEFDARGVRLGSFMLFPSLTAGVAYHDNVFNANTATGAQEDFLFTLTPTLKLNSDWGRHALNMFAESKSYFYQDFDSEDRTDWKVGGDARLDVANGTDIALKADYSETTETRGSDGFLINNFFELVEYSRWGAGASLNHVGGRFRGSLGAHYSETDYDDVAQTVNTGLIASPFCPTALPGGLRVCNNDDRDMASFEAYAKLGYAVAPGYSVFLRGKYDERDYNSPNPSFGGLEVDDAGRNRDSSGMGVDLGIDFELARLINGEAYIGYTERDYDSVLFADNDQIGFGVNLQWYASMLTTVTVSAKRSIEETSDAFAVLGASSGTVSDRYSARVDHELMRNVVVFGHIGFGQDDFEGITRQDDLLNGGLGAIFLINNNLHMTASYDYVDRDSNAALFDYSNNVFQLTVTGKL